jgi:hypothetical protein
MNDYYTDPGEITCLINNNIFQKNDKEEGEGNVKLDNYINLSMIYDYNKDHNDIISNSNFNNIDTGLRGFCELKLNPIVYENIRKIISGNDTWDIYSFKITNIKLSLKALNIYWNPIRDNYNSDTGSISNSTTADPDNYNNFTLSCQLPFNGTIKNGDVFNFSGVVYDDPDTLRKIDTGKVINFNFNEDDIKDFIPNYDNVDFLYPEEDEVLKLNLFTSINNSNKDKQRILLTNCIMEFTIEIILTTKPEPNPQPTPNPTPIPDGIINKPIGMLDIPNLLEPTYDELSKYYNTRVKVNMVDEPTIHKLFYKNKYIPNYSKKLGEDFIPNILHLYYKKRNETKLYKIRDYTIDDIKCLTHIDEDEPIQTTLARKVNNFVCNVPLNNGFNIDLDDKLDQLPDYSVLPNTIQEAEDDFGWDIYDIVPGAFVVIRNQCSGCLFYKISLVSENEYIYWVKFNPMIGIDEGYYSIILYDDFGIIGYNDINSRKINSENVVIDFACTTIGGFIKDYSNQLCFTNSTFINSCDYIINTNTYYDIINGDKTTGIELMNCKPYIIPYPLLDDGVSIISNYMDYWIVNEVAEINMEFKFNPDFRFQRPLKVKVTYLDCNNNPHLRDHPHIDDFCNLYDYNPFPDEVDDPKSLNHCKKVPNGFEFFLYSDDEIIDEGTHTGIIKKTLKVVPLLPDPVLGYGPDDHKFIIDIGYDVNPDIDCREHEIECLNKVYVFCFDPIIKTPFLLNCGFSSSFCNEPEGCLAPYKCLYNEGIANLRLEIYTDPEIPKNRYNPDNLFYATVSILANNQSLYDNPELDFIYDKPIPQHFNPVLSTWSPSGYKKSIDPDSGMIYYSDHIDIKIIGSKVNLEGLLQLYGYYSKYQSFYEKLDYDYDLYYELPYIMNPYPSLEFDGENSCDQYEIGESYDITFKVVDLICKHVDENGNMDHEPEIQTNLNILTNPDLHLMTITADPPESYNIETGMWEPRFEHEYSTVFTLTPLVDNYENTIVLYNSEPILMPEYNHIAGSLPIKFVPELFYTQLIIHKPKKCVKDVDYKIGIEYQVICPIDDIDVDENIVCTFNVPDNMKIDINTFNYPVTYNSETERYKWIIGKNLGVNSYILTFNFQFIELDDCEMFVEVACERLTEDFCNKYYQSETVAFISDIAKLRLLSLEDPSKLYYFQGCPDRSTIGIPYYKLLHTREAVTILEYPTFNIFLAGSYPEVNTIFYLLFNIVPNPNQPETAILPFSFTDGLLVEEIYYNTNISGVTFIENILTIPPLDDYRSFSVLFQMTSITPGIKNVFIEGGCDIPCDLDSLSYSLDFLVWIHSHLNANPVKNTRLGIKTNISGILIDFYNNPLGNKKIDVNIKLPDNSKVVNKVPTNDEGYYTLDYKPFKVGKYSINELYKGDDIYYQSNSYLTTFNVYSNSIFSMDKIDDIKLKEEVEIKGKLVDALGNGVGSKTILLTIKLINTKISVLETETDNDGNYLTNYTPNKTGNYIIDGVFNGDEWYYESNNIQVSFGVSV